MSLYERIVEPVVEDRDEPVDLGRWWTALPFWLVVMAAVGLAGFLVTMPKIPAWYSGLAKPFFTPPSEVFGPAWGLLYFLMAIAAWRIGASPNSPERQSAFALFHVQLALNALWSPVFFGLEAPKLAVIVILALLAALGGTVARLWRVSRLASLLLVPYLLWVGFATVLNVAIAVMN